MALETFNRFPGLPVHPVDLGSANSSLDWYLYDLALINAGIGLHEQRFQPRNPLQVVLRSESRTDAARVQLKSTAMARYCTLQPKDLFFLYEVDILEVSKLGVQGSIDAHMRMREYLERERILLASLVATR